MAEQQGVSQLGAQKANEQFAAQQALGSVYGQQGTQLQNQYGLEQGTAQAQAAIQQAQFAQDQQAAQGWAAQGAGASSLQLNALEGFTAANAQQAGTAVNQQSVSNQATQADISTGAQILGAAGTAASFLSDERQKEDKRPIGDTPHNPYADHPIAVMLDHVEPNAYRYKPEARAAAGDDGREHIGVMAQDLEKTPAGASVVIETPAGKAIDMKGASGLTLAALAHHEKRIRDLEDDNPYAMAAE
jgi:hypothetical protein